VTHDNDAVPAGWTSVPDGLWDAAQEAALQTVADSRSAEWLVRYYKTSGGYAGSTFLDASPVVSHEFTTADLFAITQLSVAAPKPRVARLILDDGPARTKLTDLLKAVPDDVDLADACSDTLEAMSALYERVRATLGRDPWVTAGKLCARKRSRLFPIRDRMVCSLLGLTSLHNYGVDWQIYRRLMNDDALVSELHTCQQRAVQQPEVRMDPYPLRWLDVILWMRATSGS